MGGDFRVGAWLVRPSLNSVSKDGTDVQVEPKVMEVLVCLASRPGESISKETIMKTVWPNTFVSDDALIRCVCELRRVFEDDARTQTLIQTIPKRGYRLVVPVEHTSANAFLSGSAVTRKWNAEAARLAASDPASVSSKLPRAFDSLAVLPLANATGDPETEYLSDGISESIINLLSQLPNLRVIPRTSAFRYKGREDDLKTVGRDLKVRTVLTGKLKHCGDRLVVQTELVDVANDAQLWGGQFNRKLDDIFEMQEELARQICEMLRVGLTPEDEKRLTKRPTQNREAYQMLLKAQFHANKWSPEGIRRGLAYAMQAIEADPMFGEAYTMLSIVYAQLGVFGFLPSAEAYPKAKAAALRALEIDDSIPDAHTALAVVAIYYEWDWSGAEQECMRAIKSNPNSPGAHSIWSDWLMIMGRHEEAIAETQLATELNPLSALFNVKLGHRLSWRGDRERALEVVNKALEFDPDFVWAYILLAQAYAQKGMYTESFTTCEKVASLWRGNPLSRVVHGLILGMVGKTEEAKQLLSELKRHPKLDPFSLIYLAATCSVIAEKKEAFELLESAYQERVPWLIYLGVNPLFENIRSDPRYLDLLDRMGLPQVALPRSS